MANVRTASEAGIGTLRPDPIANSQMQQQSLQIPAGGVEGAFGVAARQLGAAGTNLSEGLYKIQQEQDALVASKLDEDFQREVMKSAYDPDTGFFAQKGINAIGLPKTADERITEIRQRYLEQAGNARQAQLFERAASRTQQSTLEAVSRHSLTQQTAYRDERATDTMKLGAEKIALNPTDEQEFNRNLAEMESAALAKNKDKSPEGVNLALYEAGSLAYATRASQLLQSENPMDIERGNALFDKAQKGGHLTFEHVQKLDGLRDAALPKALAQRGLAEVRASSTFGTADIDAIFDKGVVGTESRGNQFAADGVTPLTSSAGAVGAAQVMRGTGPEAAAAAGLPWDEERWKTDKAYNLAIGKAYFKKQVAAFDDKTLGTLAYNWGPGSVLEHISKVGDPRKGEVSMSEFLATVPSSEARAYVGKVQGNLGAGNGAAAPDIGLVMGKAAELDAIHPGAGATFLSAYKAERSAIEDADKDYKLGVKDKIAGQLAAANGDISKVNSRDRAEAVRLGIWDDASKFSGRTDTSALYDLRAMPDEKFVQLDLREYSDKLSQDDLLKEQTRQQTLQKGDQAYKDFASRRDDFFVQVNGSKDNADKKARFSIRADEAFYSFQKANNRGPNQDEARTILQTLALKADSSSDFGKKDIYTYQAAENFEIKDIPKEALPYYSQILNDYGYDINRKNLDAVLDDPLKIVGKVEGVPDDVAGRIIPMLVKGKQRVTPYNIRAAYQIARRNDIVQNAPAADAPIFTPDPRLNRNPAFGN